MQRQDLKRSTSEGSIFTTFQPLTFVDNALGLTAPSYSFIGVMLSRSLSSLEAMLEHSLQTVSRPSKRLLTALSISPSFVLCTLRPFTLSSLFRVTHYRT